MATVVALAATALGSVGAAMGAGAATSALAQVVGGAMVGAATGAVTAAVKGDDILKGAVIGGLGGATIGFGANLAAPWAAETLAAEGVKAAALDSAAILDLGPPTKEAMMGMEAAEAAEASLAGVQSGSTEAIYGALSQADMGGMAGDATLGFGSKKTGGEGLSMMETAMAGGMVQAGAAAMAPDPGEGEIKALQEAERIKIAQEEREKLAKEEEEEKDMVDYQSPGPISKLRFEKDAEGNRTYRRENIARVNTNQLLSKELKDLKTAVAVKPVTVFKQGALSGGIV